MRRWTLVALVLAATTAACANGGSSVSRTGFSVRDGRVGFGALVRATEPLREVELEISIMNDGRAVSTQTDTLPHCSPGRDCWWGTGFFHEGPVDDVLIRVIRSTSAAEDVPPIRELAVSKHGADVRLRAPGAEGTVYLLAFERGRPRYGLSFFTGRGDRGELRYERQTFPVREGEQVRAFFYPGPVPGSVYGPID